MSPVPSSKQLYHPALAQGNSRTFTGEELGMTNVKFGSIEDYRDGDSIRFLRDMHTPAKRLSHEEGDAGNSLRPRIMHPVRRIRNGGFCSRGCESRGCEPELPGDNAEAVLADEDSIFYHYQQLVALRRGKLKT